MLILYYGNLLCEDDDCLIDQQVGKRNASFPSSSSFIKFYYFYYNGSRISRLLKERYTKARSLYHMSSNTSSIGTKYYLKKSSSFLNHSGSKVTVPTFHILNAIEFDDTPTLHKKKKINKIK